MKFFMKTYTIHAFAAAVSQKKLNDPYSDEHTARRRAYLFAESVAVGGSLVLEKREISRVITVILSSPGLQPSMEAALLVGRQSGTFQVS